MAGCAFAILGTPSETPTLSLPPTLGLLNSLGPISPSLTPLGVPQDSSFPIPHAAPHHQRWHFIAANAPEVWDLGALDAAFRAPSSLVFVFFSYFLGADPSSGRLKLPNPKGTQVLPPAPVAAAMHLRTARFSESSGFLGVLF